MKRPTVEEQLSLPPASHRRDPASSFEAEAEVTLSGQRQTNKEIVLRAVRVVRGLTSRELADLIGMDYHEVRRRLSDLVDDRDGRVRHGEQRPCRFAGRKCVTWWPTNKETPGG
jgi:hypothetical protein